MALVNKLPHLIDSGRPFCYLYKNKAQNVFARIRSHISTEVARSMESEPLIRAKRWVQRAKHFYKMVGRELALTEFSDHNGIFIKGDLFIFVLDFMGNMLANGNDKKLVGDNLIETEDSRGKHFIKEIVELASLQGCGNIDYTWYNPVVAGWMPGSAYFEAVDDMIFCATVY